MNDQTVQFNPGFMDSPRWIRLFWYGSFAFIVLILTVLLFVANLYYGELNQDEGWYLYAGRLILEGQVPYRDFAFTQGPVMAYVYALAQPLVKLWGVAGGRLFTGLIGLLSALAAAVLAARLVRPRFRSGAALIAFILIMVNVYQSYYFTVVKTYSLCSFFLVFGFLFLREALELRSRAAVFLAGMAFVLATATRSSAGIVLPVVFCLLALDRRTLFRSACVFFALGAAFMAALVFGPFLLLTPDNFLFMVLRYHTLRESGTVGARLLFKAGFISRLVQAYLPAMTIGATLVVFHLFKLNRIRNRKWIPPPPNTERLSRMIWISVAAVSLVHLLAP
ncbi:MAG: glycosyltransferase family 39 protein, partial [Lentisphaerae bacterium]|nr:glycosyltransferase family 39 protein [Lentisphaerota bacterium]